nr:MAG TPA: hypothetical protein [Caudoviricetes sp.]
MPTAIQSIEIRLSEKNGHCLLFLELCTGISLYCQVEIDIAGVVPSLNAMGKTKVY